MIHGVWRAPTVHFIFSSFDKLCTHGAFICVCVCGGSATWLLHVDAKVRWHSFN